MSVTRRDILRFAGAATAGLVISPLPWKMLDDVAIWTQTGPWIPKVPRGPISHVTSLCSVCPAGCPVTARCVAGVPSVLRASAGSGQPLCPIGLTGHHLAFHPLRVSGPCLVERHGDRVATTPVTIDEALRRLPDMSGGRTVMIVDQRPGRAISDHYRAYVRQHPGSTYAIPDGDGSLHAVGYDLERVRTILAVTTPLLDGWTTPARTARLMERHISGDDLRIIAADPARSRTAMLADRWMPIRPGSEGALLVALMQHTPVARRSEMPPTLRHIIERSSPERLAAAIGVTAVQVRHLYDKLTERGPALVIVGGNGCEPLDAETERIATSLNRALGATECGALRGRPAIPVSGGLHERVLAPATPLSAVPEASVDLVILDGDEGTCHLTWEPIARTLRPGRSLVVSLSPVLTALASHADIILPSPAPYETLGESTGDGTDVVCRFGISRPLHPRRTGSVDAETVLTRLSGRALDHETILRAKVAGLWSSRRGRVVQPDGSASEIATYESPEALWTALLDGAVWSQDGTSSAISIRVAPAEADDEARWTERLETLVAAGSSAGITVVPTVWSPVTSVNRLSPLMTKLYQESGLRPTTDVASIAPVTANAHGVEDGVVAELRAGERSSSVKVRINDRLAPGTVLLAAGPDPVGFRSPEPPVVASAAPRGRAVELRKS